VSEVDDARGGRPGAGGEDAPGLFGRPWLLAALACAVASAACWWRGLGDAAFVTAALGVVCYFLNQRGKYRRIRDEHKHAQEQTTADALDADERD
jgi:hypothetical protein